MSTFDFQESPTSPQTQFFQHTGNIATCARTDQPIPMNDITDRDYHLSFTHTLTHM